MKNSLAFLHRVLWLLNNLAYCSSSTRLKLQTFRVFQFEKKLFISPLDLKFSCLIDLLSAWKYLDTVTSRNTFFTLGNNRVKLFPRLLLLENGTIRFAIKLNKNIRIKQNEGTSFSPVFLPYITHANQFNENYYGFLNYG